MPNAANAHDDRPAFLTVAEVADLSRVQESTVRYWLWKSRTGIPTGPQGWRQIPGTRRQLLPRADFDAWVSTWSDSTQ